MATPASQSAILWQNATKTVTLLDIPLSISLAQGTSDCPCTARIHSSPALQIPYPSTEPKTEKAKANVLRTRSCQCTDAEFPSSLLEAAQAEIAERWNHGWCWNRQISPCTEGRRDKKRKRDAEDDNMFNGEVAGSSKPSVYEPNEPPSSVLFYEEALDVGQRQFHDPLDVSASTNHLAPRVSLIRTRISNRLVYNCRPHPLSLKHEQASAHKEVVYVIPPRSSFVVSKIDHPSASVLSMAALTMFPANTATTEPGQFDFILLDPPWDNRSVKRSAKYKTMQESEPMEVLQSMLGLHIGPNALMACWITNKASVRAAAVAAFEVWNVQPIEEWAWLKTTEHGEPVMSIDGFWRKPFEILLIGRKSKMPTCNVGASIKRRVIVAVPDFHSRKPNIKALVEPMLPETYRALEIFARNLTAEWMAWGDDVLKYAWDGYYE